MDLTNIEGIEDLECVTVFTEAAFKLSEKLTFILYSTLQR